MRSALVWILTLCIARVASAGHPEQFLDWEDVPGPPGRNPAGTVATAGGVLYAGASDGGVYRFDDKTGTWEPYGLAGLRVWKLAADGDTLCAFINNRLAGGLYRADSGGGWTQVPSSHHEMRLLGVSRGTAYMHADGLKLMDLNTGALTPTSLLVRDVDIRRLDYQRVLIYSSLRVATEAGHNFVLHEHGDTW